MKLTYEQRTFLRIAVMDDAVIERRRAWLVAESDSGEKQGLRGAALNQMIPRYIIWDHLTDAGIAEGRRLRIIQDLAALADETGLIAHRPGTTEAIQAAVDRCQDEIIRLM